jgi:hypothetical protein
MIMAQIFNVTVHSLAYPADIPATPMMFFDGMDRAFPVDVGSWSLAELPTLIETLCTSGVDGTGPISASVTISQVR